MTEDLEKQLRSLSWEELNGPSVNKLLRSCHDSITMLRHVAEMAMTDDTRHNVQTKIGERLVDINTITEVRSRCLRECVELESIPVQEV